MHKFVPAILAFALLSGCGTTANPLAKQAAANAAKAQSLAGASKGVHQMFKAAFVAADKNRNGSLSADEMPGSVPVVPAPGSNAGAVGDPKALFATLDANKDGKVGFREFNRPDMIAAAVAVLRFEVGKAYAALDKNGDRTLTPNEFEGTPFNVMAFDFNKNGKVTVSEFEDAYAALLGSGPDPIDPPAPPAPVEPAPPAPAEPVEPAPDEPAPPAPPAPTNPV